MKSSRRVKLIAFLALLLSTSGIVQAQNEDLDQAVAA